MMNMELILLAAIFVLAIAFVALLDQFLRLKRLVLAVRDTKTMPTTPAQIKAWREKMSLYPEGSPKYKAYRNRIVQATRGD